VSSPLPTSITELVSGAAGLIAVVSGLVAAATRSVTILGGLSAETIDRLTAVGFLVGAVLANAILGIEVGGG
jgi:hypothetical protein